MNSKIELSCPRCGGDLNGDAANRVLPCGYCGAKILLVDENTYTIRYVDEAKVKQAEAEHSVKMKQLEMAEKRHEMDRRNLKLRLIAAVAIAVAGFAMLVGGYALGGASGDPDSPFYIFGIVGLLLIMGSGMIWFYTMDKDSSLDFGSRVRIPDSLAEYRNKNFQAVETILQNAGFVDIQCIPLKDLSVGVIRRPGLVESITIDGNIVRSAGERYSALAPVVIAYHSFPEN